MRTTQINFSSKETLKELPLSPGEGASSVVASSPPVAAERKQRRIAGNPIVKAVDDKIDDEISALDRLDLEDITVLRERRLQQKKKMVEKRRQWPHDPGVGTVTAYHLKNNGQAEVSNSEIKHILEKVVCPSKKDWSLKLDEAIWAYRTLFKTPLGMSPFQLVYDKGCHLPVELEHKTYWALKKLNLDMHAASKKRMFQLNELDEFRLQAYENNKMYKEKVKRWHDRGPFIVKTVFPHGAVGIFENDPGQEFKMNGQDLKHYYGDTANREVIAYKTAKEIWDALETQCQGTMAIKKNRRAVLIQEYEHFEAKPDKSLTNIYDRFLTLLNNLSLVGKVYDREE
ncbi:hypothetical protein AgCh_005291 [Apium graveolens]